MSVNGTVLDPGETATSPRVRAAVGAAVIALIYHRLARDPEAVKRLPSGQAWLESVMMVPEPVRHLSVHRGHNWDVSNGHDGLIDTSAAEQLTFTGTPEALRARLARLAAAAPLASSSASGADVERELHAFARLVDLRPR